MGIKAAGHDIIWSAMIQYLGETGPVYCYTYTIVPQLFSLNIKYGMPKTSVTTEE